MQCDKKKVIDKIQIQTSEGSVTLINRTFEEDWRVRVDGNCIYRYVKINSVTIYRQGHFIRILYEDSTGEHSIYTGIENVVVYY